MCQRLPFAIEVKDTSSARAADSRRLGADACARILPCFFAPPIEVRQSAQAYMTRAALPGGERLGSFVCLQDSGPRSIEPPRVGLAVWA
jgi:hypothetical protein